jgi:NodT family efflux transporter outer membrane factor (OMF) lipoprotein
VPIDSSRAIDVAGSAAVTRPHGGSIRTALVAAVLLLGACAHVPDIDAPARPRPLETLASARSFDAPPGDWPTGSWWQAFGDTQLDEWVAEALATSPSLEQAGARVREAAARAWLARAARLPSLGLNAAADERKLTYRGLFPPNAIPHGWNDVGRATLDFSWELDFWGRNRMALEGAVSEARASEAENAAARVLVTTSVAQTYMQLQGLFVQSDLAREALKAAESSERLVRRRLAEGLETETALEQARARSNQATADVAEVGEQTSLARDALAALAGQGPDRGLQVRRTGLSARRPFGLPAALAADLLGRKPEVVAARWRVEAAARRVGVAKTAFYPNVNLLAFIGFESLGLKNLGASGSDTGSVGVAIHLPIFDGGRLAANYRAAGAQYDAAVAGYDAALTQALRETADAAQGLQSLEARLRPTQAALASAEKAYRLAQRRYEAGLADFQSVLTTEDAMLQIRRGEAALRTRGVLLDIALIKALGGGFETDPRMQAQVNP